MALIEEVFDTALVCVEVPNSVSFLPKGCAWPPPKRLLIGSADVAGTANAMPDDIFGRPGATSLLTGGLAGVEAKTGEKPGAADGTANEYAFRGLVRII